MSSIPPADLVTGATGFVGRNLVTALRAAGRPVIATTRRPVASIPRVAGVEWRTCDLLAPATLPAALAGARVAYYLVHSMAGDTRQFRARERRSAENFAAAAAAAGLARIVYLGGPAPPGHASQHLLSRLEVGEILRAGAVPAVELRAAMIIGHGSASWRIVRDLAFRLPAMVLPRWLRSRSRPVALDDVIDALVAAADLPLAHSEWFDLPGPEVLSGRQILERVAHLAGKRFVAVEVPVLTPRLSSLWLKLVTRTDFGLARELVDGLAADLLPVDDRYWRLIGHPHLVGFDEAVRRALARELTPAGGRATPAAASGR